MEIWEEIEAGHWSARWETEDRENWVVVKVRFERVGGAQRSE